MLAMVVNACLKEETTPQFSAPTNGEFAVTPSATSVAAAAKDSLTTALTINWTDPKFSVGLKSTKFTLIVAKAGTNFSTFQTKEFTNALSGDLTGKELNGMAARFGATVGQPISLDMKVVASLLNNNEPRPSNPFQVAVTPFSGFGLVPSPAAVTTNAATPSAVAVTFNWNKGFSGFSGVITYQLQYAKEGTAFAASTTIDVTGLNKTLTHLELNNIALGYNIAPSTAGNVEFRIKASNELGVVNYSSVAIVSVTPYIAINSVGIIGDASPGGWNVDTDLYRPDASKPSEWEVIVYLIGGKEVLFRENDLWDTKWGVGGKGGANIPITNSGYYRAKLNVATGVYSFTPITVPSIPNGLSLTGDGIGGWGVDTNLTQSGTDANVYTGTVNLTVGSVKFRHTGDWNINWGGPAGDNDPQNYPSAWGKGGGGNIKINTAGSYFVSINIATGEYAFGPADRGTPFADVGIIGDSTPNGWGSDTDLIKNPANPYKWSKKLTLVNGEAKFRANNDWGTNWGDAPFPAGVGAQNGSNIKNVTSGTYQISFNSLTGEYTFVK